MSDLLFLLEELPKNITDKYDYANNSFITKDKIEVNDEFEIEVGDIKQEDFYPQVKIKRWDNECNFSARLVNEDIDVGVGAIEELNKIVWEKEKVKACFYTLNSTEVGNKKGGFEFEVILKEKPISNVVRFSVQSKELNFYYQPEISDKKAQESLDEYATIIAQGKPSNVSSEIWQRALDDAPTTLLEAKRKIRPENVVNSYAVYHTNKKGDYTQLGGKNYRAGKAFHVYRPKITDADGNWIWGELQIDPEQGILSVTIDRPWLNKAVYPVRHVAGLTFGNTNEAESKTGRLSTDRIYAIDGSPERDGIGDTMHVYWEGYFSNDHRCALYDGGDVITNSITDEQPDPAWNVTQWDVFNFSASPNLLSTATYRLSLFLDGNTPSVYYDSGTGYIVTDIC